MNDRCFLYHVFGPEYSAGLGFDGYVVTTHNMKRRKTEHMRAVAAGRHPNPRFQNLYDDAGGKLSMRLVRCDTKEEVLASDELVVTAQQACEHTSGGAICVG